MEVISRMLDGNVTNASPILNIVAKALAKKTTFFDDLGWEEVLLNIFREQHSRESERKADEARKTLILQKSLQIAELEKELRKHVDELHNLMDPPASLDDIGSGTVANVDDQEDSAASRSDDSNLSTCRLAVKIQVRNMPGNRQRHGSSSTKDKNRLKAPLNPYLIWKSKNYKRVQKANPDWSFVDLCKECGKLWNALEDKSEWFEKAAEARCIYKRKLEAKSDII